MNTINPACPPIPTLDELLNSGNFIEVNATQLEVGETVILYDSDVPDQNYQIMCVEILTNLPENAPNDVFGFRYLSGAYPHLNNTHTTMYRRWLHNERFFRKIDYRKDFDKIAKTMRVRMRGYPEDEQLTTRETILANKGLSDHIGQFLGLPTSGKGGRRKQRKTKRTRKNKRKTRKHRKVRRL